MGTTWIVSANAGRARVLEASSDRDNDLQEVHSMVSPTGRMQTAELETDRVAPKAAGKSSHGTGGATPTKTYQPAVTAEQHETEKFARSLCDFLQQAQVEGRFQHLILVAEPQFLGVLRKQLSPQMQPLIREEHNKDYTQLANRELAEQLHLLREKESGWAPPRPQHNPASQTFR